MAFFPPNKSKLPHPGSWKPGPGASLCSQPGGQGGASPHGGSPELKSLQLLPNLQTLGNFSHGLLGITAAGRGKLWFLFLKRGFVGLGFFIHSPCPRGFKVLLSWVLGSSRSWMQGSLLAAGFSLWETSQRKLGCKWDCPGSAVGSESCHRG